MTTRSDTRSALADVIWVAGACLTYDCFEALHVPKRWSFLAMGVVLAVYSIYLARRRTDSWHDLGFRIDNLVAALLPIGGSTLVAAGGIIAVAVARGRAVWGTDGLLLLALYPAWALAQQLAFQGILHRRLMQLVRGPALPVLITALAFMSVHFGNPILMALTFSAGLGWSLLYRRWPNLWLLAGSHSIVAALAYPLLLVDAPLSRL